MSSSDAWQAVVERIAEEPDPSRSPARAELWKLAIDEARRALRNMDWLTPEDIEDIVQAKLYERFEAIVAADNARAFFRTCVCNEALSLKRRPSRRLDHVSAPEALTEDGDEGGPGRLGVVSHDPDTGPEHAAAVREEVRFQFRRLDDRERQIFAAIAADEDRDDIARALGLSRDNVDQIVSRARKRLREES